MADKQRRLKINREGYDALGMTITDWFDELGLELDSDMEVDLINRVLDCLRIEKEW